MELTVFNIKGEKTAKTVKLSDGVFGIEPNDHAIWLDTRQILANRRQGTHDTTERADIQGSTKKIKRQKGTGTARAGSIKSPLFRGGGRVFGPHPRDYSFKLNKKVKRLARLSALSYKAKENEIVVLEDFSFEKPRTRDFAGILQAFELTGKNALLVIRDTDLNLVLSARNIQKARISRARDLNTYEILKARKLLITESSVAEIEQVLGKVVAE
jgi:large subunit ribosomal protein L4